MNDARESPKEEEGIFKIAGCVLLLVCGLVAIGEDAFAIEGNFRTCLIQTGANCFLRCRRQAPAGPGSSPEHKRGRDTPSKEKNIHRVAAPPLSDTVPDRGDGPERGGCSGPSGPLIILISGTPLPSAAGRRGWAVGHL